ncbi:MAG: lytic transglycosylase domain-containing protein [Flavisolibacter sp.]
MKHSFAFIHFALGALCCFLILSQFAFKTNSVSDTRQQWFVPSLPESISFAGEKVPVSRWDVKEKFDKEMLINYYDQGTIIYLIKLANRNFPVISERLRANGVPDDFKYLCIAESNMQSWAVSKAGAVGYWQFLSGTAPGYGLETSSEVDQRQDLEKSTDAACVYFKQAFEKFGNWTAAAASYNCGMGGYGKQATFQHTMNYYDLQLPEETNKYIFRILSFKFLLENADALGFHLNDEEKYQPVTSQSLTVSSSIPDLAQFAIDHGTTYKILHAMNPWLKGHSLSVAKGKTYTLHLPVQKSF